MKTARIIVILSAVACCILFQYAATESGEFKDITRNEDFNHRSGKVGKYRALIIGINEYKDPNIPKLTTCVNDAKAMAKLLEEKYGFNTELIVDKKATRKAIHDALRSFSASAEPDDNILIYYSGHGAEDKAFNDGWWIPSDAKAGDFSTYLDNTLVQKAIGKTKARHALLISDSCYSGTLFGQETKTMPPNIDEKYYLNLYNEKSRWGMTSGNKKERVSDERIGIGGHSIFAYHLLKQLGKNKRPYISTQEIYTGIAPIIANNSEQTPLCRPLHGTGDDGGEFVFILADTPTESAPVYTPPVSQKPSPSVSGAKYNLRSEPITTDNESDFKSENVKNEFEDNGDGTITDRATGLMWQESGSPNYIDYDEAKAYVKNLNRKGFAGHNDWRLPTADELKSLLTPKEMNGDLYIDPIFDKTQRYCWTSDQRASGGAWNVSFGDGNVNWRNLVGNDYVRAVRSRQ